MDRLPASIKAIAVGRGLSILGDQVALITLAFRAKAELGHFGLAAIALAGTLPLLVLAPWAGLLVDRVRTRPILLMTLVVQGLLCIGLALVSGWWLLALIAALAAGTAVVNPAWGALVPILVADSELPAAIGLQQSLTTAAQTMGPLLGGVLVYYSGFHVPLLGDAVTFFVLVLVAALLRVDRIPSGVGQERVRGETFRGVTFIWHHRGLHSLVILLTVFIAAISVIDVSDIFFITDVLHGSALAYGVFFACFGIGMLAATLTARRHEALAKGPDRLIVLACGTMAVGILIVGSSLTVWQASLGAVMTGIGNGIANVQFGILIARRTTDAVRGRVMAIVGGTFGAASIIGFGVGGVLVTLLGSRWVLLGGAMVSGLSLLLTARPVLRGGEDLLTQPA